MSDLEFNSGEQNTCHLFGLISFIFFEMAPAVSSGLQHTIEERIVNYKAAILNAKEAGESSKVRRYERGLKVCWDHRFSSF